MPYVAPSTVTTLQTYGSAAHNIIVNDIIDHESRIAASEAAWTSFTPTLSGGFANGNASAVGAYLQVGKTVNFWGYVSTGSTSTYGAALRISLPVAAKSVDAQIGVKAYASVAGSTYVMIVLPGTTASNIELATVSASGTYAFIAQTTATVPATWATSSLIRYAGTYEAA